MMGSHLLLLLSHPRSPSIVPYGTLDHLENSTWTSPFPGIHQLPAIKSFRFLLGAIILLVIRWLFFGYKDRVFSFLNNPKNLDLSDKTDLDLWDCLGRVKLVLWQTFVGLI